MTTRLGARVGPESHVTSQLVLQHTGAMLLQNKQNVRGSFHCYLPNMLVYLPDPQSHTYARLGLYPVSMPCPSHVHSVFYSVAKTRLIFRCDRPICDLIRAEPHDQQTQG